MDSAMADMDRDMLQDMVSVVMESEAQSTLDIPLSLFIHHLMADTRHWDTQDWDIHQDWDTQA